MPFAPADRRLAEAVAAIYAAAPAPALWPESLQTVADAFGDVAANLFYIRQDGSFGMVVSPAMVELQKAYDAGWWKHDIRTMRALERGYGAGVEAITDRHVATEEEIAEHPFYRDFARAYGMGLFAAVPISPDPRSVLAITIHRSGADKPPYTDEELAAVQWIGRHAENALRLSSRLITAEMTNLAFSEALTRVDVGVFLIDSLGRVVVTNAIADSLVGDALVMPNGRLAARFEPARSALEATVAAALGPATDRPGTPRPIVLKGLDSDTYAVAYVLPVRTDDRHPLEAALFDARAIVVVRRANREDPLDPSLVRDLLNLTSGEARVAALVGAGARPTEAAERLGIAPETARTVLKRVFAKTGVSRQSDLAGLLTRLVLR